MPRLRRAAGAAGAERALRAVRVAAAFVSHERLAQLAIAHVDCDAFYAAVEKRERPELAHRPVIVGGGKRGVVLACCYVARLYGVRSAMPMFKALDACPDAEVIRPDMAKYREVGRAVRNEMRRLTPLVEPVSIDEAFLDLSGTAAVHGAAPAQLLAALARRIEEELGITLSIGLSDSKFLAKIASDLDKPRGFAVLDRRDAPAFFTDKPVSLLWGVGAAMQRRLAADGITVIGQLAVLGERELAVRYGPDRRAPSPAWRKGSTTAPCLRTPPPARSRQKRHCPATRPRRRRSRRFCGHCASACQRNSRRRRSPRAPSP